MEYFKSGLKSVLGAPTPENQPSGAETVEKLVDRVLSSTLLDDRRDACRALKALSLTYRIEVGAQGIGALKQVLDMDRSDYVIVGFALDILCNITCPDTFEEEVNKYETKHNIGEQFTEILIKNQDIVSQVLRFLEEFDFRVRWSALKLLANLTVNKLKEIQEIILESPMGISKLMDMLGDSREVIRNDALLLLIQLTKGNTNIQKIVAFENAFDRIFDVILQEDGVEGGIIVEDCLLLMVNLLRGNHSNQYFFKEGSYIQRLTPMLQLATDINDDNILIGWSPQKVSNVHCIIQVIRALVAPSAPAISVSACQKIMKTCGLLQTLCDILMISGVPADILTEAISAVAEVIRGNTRNQDFLASVMAPSTPPRPIMVVLLMSMVNEKQPFFLRCAVLYCFQCFLYKNDIRQMQLIETLLPQSNENHALTTGQLLCGGLFSSDPLSNWFSSVGLSYALIDSLKQKEQLLRVLLATNIGTPPTTLMHQCVTLLQQSNKIQSKLGLLMLVCRWISYSPLAVKSFISIDSSISYLIALLSSHENTDDLPEILLQSMCAFLIGICVHFNDDSVSNYTKAKLCSLVENRIGLEKFQDIMGCIMKHEVYSRSLKHPQSCARSAAELLLDHEFCRLLKVLEGIVLKSVLDFSHSDNNKEEINVFSPSDSAIIIQYKEMIREQDLQIQKMSTAINNLTKEKEEFQERVHELQCEIDSLSDQMKVLRASKRSYSEKVLSSISCNTESTNNDMEKYKIQVKDLEIRLSESLTTIEQLKIECLENKDCTVGKKLRKKIEECDKLKKDQEDLLELLTDQDNKIIMYKKKLISLGEKVDSDESSGELDTDNHHDLRN